MDENKMITFVYDESFDLFDTWEILGNGPVRFVHGNQYTVSFEGATYFLIYGIFSGKDKWSSIDMAFQGWACDIEYKELIELIGDTKNWISIVPSANQ
jgi:hypothetical protein